MMYNIVGDKQTMRWLLLLLLLLLPFAPARASEAPQVVVDGERGLALRLAAIQERVGWEVVVGAEGREARRAIETLIVRRPWLQIRPVYLSGGGDKTRRLRKEMERYDLACGLRVLPVSSSTEWLIIAVGQCGDDWADIPAGPMVLSPSPEEKASSTTICLSDGQTITGEEMAPPQGGASRLLKIHVGKVEIPATAQGEQCTGQLSRTVPLRKLKRLVLADFQTLYGQPKDLGANIRVGLLNDTHVDFSSQAIRTWGEPTGLDGYSAVAWSDDESRGGAGAVEEEVPVGLDDDPAERPVGGRDRDMYKWVVLVSGELRGDWALASLTLDVRRALNPWLAVGGGVGDQVMDSHGGASYMAWALPQAYLTVELGPGRSLDGVYGGLWAGLLTTADGRRSDGGWYYYYRRVAPEAGAVAGWRFIWHPGFVLDAQVGLMAGRDYHEFPGMGRVGLGWAPQRPGTAPRPGYRDGPKGWAPEERLLVGVLVGAAAGPGLLGSLPNQRH